MDQSTINNPTPQQNTNGNMGANNQNPFNKFSLEGAKGCFGLSKAAVIGIAVLLILGIYGCSKRNSFVSQDTEITAAWSEVESQYQRRSDLYTTIAANVKKYDKHERETYQGVTNARANANKPNTEQQDDALKQIQALADSAQSLKNVKANPNDLNSMKDYINAQNKLKEQMSLAINVVHEAYPDLKAEDLHKDFQKEMEGTENRIQRARQKYIEKVKEYNRDINLFPGNMIAKVFGFKERPFYEADKGTEKAPDVGKMLED